MNSTFLNNSIRNIPLCDTQMDCKYNNITGRQVCKFPEVCLGKLFLLLGISVVIYATIVVLNTLVIVIFATTKNLRNECSLYKISLAVSDLLVGLTGFARIAYNRYTVIRCFSESKPDASKPFELISTHAMLVSMYMLALASWHQYKKLHDPFHNDTDKNAKRKVKVKIVAVWIALAAVCAAITFNVTSPSCLYPDFLIPLDYVSFVYVLLLVLPLVFTIVVNILSLSIVHGMMTRRQQMTGAQVIDDNENRFAMTVFIMVVTFTTCITPYCIYIVYTMLETKRLGTEFGNKLYSLETPLMFLFMSNSIWNCVIYSFRIPSFRNATIKLFTCKKCCTLCHKY